MKTTNIPKRRLGFRILAGYLAANVLLFVVDPYSSRWHYGSQNPAPIEIARSTDSDLSSEQIITVLDSIDLAYGARAPTKTEKLWRTGLQVIGAVCLPSSFALVMKGFIGYMGPANSQQRAFTVSVKKRYNHLARLAVNKGMSKDGYLFQEEPSLSKIAGEPFASLR